MPLSKSVYEVTVAATAADNDDGNDDVTEAQ